MASYSSDPWSPRQTTENTFTPTGTSQTPLSTSRHSYTSQSDNQRQSSDGDDSAHNMRRIVISPSPSRENSHSDDTYSDDNSLEEVEATLNNLDDEFEDTEQALSHWTRGSSRQSYTSPGTFTSSYTGSPSFTSLPTFTSRSPVLPHADPRMRLSRITERTEDSRPTSGAFSAAAARQVTRTPDNLRRSALLGGGTPSHSRSSTDPSSDRTLPPPGRTTELIAVFEAQSPAGGHGRAASTPGFRAPSPLVPPTTTTGYEYGSTSYGYGSTSYGYGSRPSSPTKSSGSSGSYTGPSLLSPPVHTTSTSGFRSTTPGGTQTGTGSYTSPPTYTATPSTFSNTLTQSYTNTNTNTYTTGTPYTQSVTGTPYTQSVTGTPYTNTGSFTQTSVTPPAGLRRPQASPRSPLASVRNIVALWKERTPTKSGERPGIGSGSSVSPPLPDDEGLFGIRRRVQRAGQRLRETGVRDPIAPTRPGNQLAAADNASIRSIRSGVLPAGFDAAEFSPYTQSEEAPLHIGMLWYLNVHASPPYRWQRCQALLYPHMLLLSWLAPGGGRGIVALDLLNCTSVQSAPSPTHPSARDDVGTFAARLQSSERDGQPLMDMLVPFHMLYADGVERLAAESLLERQKWVNRLWEAVNRPVAMPESSSITRSPTGSIRTILSIDSRSSNSSVGSRSTVFVPPLSSLPDISDVPSSHSSYRSGLSRHSSLVSSHHTGTVDDMVIQNQEYVYPGDRRVINPQRGPSLRRTGSMTDLDEEFRSALERARGARPGLGFPSQVLGGSPVTISSGSSLGKNIFVTPPPSIGRGSDKARSDITDEHFFSAGSSGTRSNVSSTYFSQSPASFTSSGGLQTTTGLRSDTITGLTSDTQAGPSTFSMTRGSLSDSGSYLGDSRGDSASLTAMSSTTLSRARQVRRRAGTGTRSSTLLSEGISDKENYLSGSGSYTPGSGTYTPGSGSYVAGSGSGSYTESGSYTPGSGSYTPGSGSYTPGSGSYTSASRSLESGSYTPSGGYTASGSYTPSQSYVGSGSYTPSGSHTPSSGSYTLENGSRTLGSHGSSSSSGIGRTPISSSETGYDICPSSDFTSLEPTPFTSDTETATPVAPASVVSDVASDILSEKYVTASQASTEYVSASQGSDEYLTAEVASSGESTLSFRSLSSIPSLSSYKTAKSISSYRTASEPGEPTEYVTADLCLSEPATEYITAELCPSEVEDIPSEKSTPRLSSLHLSSEPDEEVKSIHRVPSLVPTIRSLSSISDLMPEEIPLPISLYSSSATPTPVIPLSTLSPTPLQSTEESSDVQTPSSLRTLTVTAETRRLETEDSESLVSSLPLSTLPPTTFGSETSVLTPSSLAISSGSTTAGTLPPSTARVSPTTIASFTSSLSSSISDSVDLTTFTQSSSSLAPPPQRWDAESNASYESSMLEPSPSLLSIALPEGHDTSFETSILRASGSVSSIDRLSTIPQSPLTSASASVQSPLQSLTPVPRLPSSISSSSDIKTPTSLSSSVSTQSAPQSLQSPSPRLPPSSIYSDDAMTPTSLFLSVSAHSPLQSLTPVPRLSPSTTSATDMATPASLISFGSAHSPLRSLTPVPSLPLTVSSATDVRTPASLSFSLASSSSLGRTPSTFSSSSFVSQSSLSSYIFDSRSLLEEPGFDVDLESEPSTEPSLLTTPPGSARLPSLAPSSPPSTHLATPEGSVVVSFSTPHGAADSEKSSLKTTETESAVTERDIGRDIDRLAEELRRYDDARGLENQDIADNIRTLQDELRGLSDFLHRVPSPEAVQQTTQPQSVPVTTTPRPQMQPQIQPQTTLETPRGVQLVDRAAGGSSVVSSLRPGGPRDMDPGVSLSRATSSASSIGSYLSSHHSDDDLLEESYPPSPPLWHSSVESDADIEETLSSSTYTSSSPGSSSTPPLPPSSPSPSSSVTETETVRPIASPPDVLGPLSAIREQLNALQEGQVLTNELMGTLRDRPVPVPEDHTAELTDRLHRIEELLRDLLGQEHPRAPQVVIERAPTEPSEVAESISGSTSSEGRLQAIDHLRDILRNISGGTEPHMPIPVAPTVGPSLSQQLDEILSAGSTLPPLQIQHPPPFVPFVFEPTDRSRLRSTSPISIETLPTRPYTEPPLPEPVYRDPRGPGRRRTVSRRLPPRPEGTIPQAPADFPPQEPIQYPVDEDAERILRDLRRQRDERHQEPITQPETFHHGRGPPPGPGHPPPISTQDIPPRSQTAPHDLASGDPRRGPSWYLPSRDQRHRPPPIIPPPSILQQGQPRPMAPQTQQVPQAQQVPQVPLPGQQQVPTYLPMPAGPTVVQMPPLFNSLLEILRENRLAQLATVDQQRELMRYMRGLNGWLERDVRDRQSELRGVIARVDQLRDDLRGMRSQVHLIGEPSDGTGSPDGPLGPQMPQPQFRPGPQMPTPHHFGGPQMPTPQHVGGPQMPQPQHVAGLPPGFQPYPMQIIPPVIPQERRTPTPPFPPVIPQMPQQQPGFIMVNQPGVPVIPMDGFRPPSRMHSVPPPQHMEQPPTPFIPPMTGSHSTGSPRRHPMMQMPMHHPMGPSVIHVPAEEESSSARSSSPRSSSRGRYRDSGRTRPSRSGTRRTGSSRRSHRRSRSSSRSSRSRTPPQQILVTPGPGMTPGMIPAVMHDPRLQHFPPVHVIPPSAPGSVLSPGGPRHPELQGQLPQQQPPSTIIIQQPGQQPMMGQTPMPMGQPMMTGPSGLPYAPPGAGPVIFQEESPLSSRSSSRSGRRRSHSRHRATPPIMAGHPAAPPIILADTRRSSSPGRPLEPYTQMPPPTTILPPQLYGTGPPGAIIIPARSRSPRSSSSRSSRGRRRRRRSDSYEPPMIIGGTPSVPAYPPYPQPTGTAPTQVLLPGGMVGQPPPVVFAGSHSRSRSRSPRQPAVPIIVPPIQQQPTHHDHRSSPRSSRRRGDSPRPAYPAYPAQVVIPSGYRDSPSPRGGERYPRDRGRRYSSYSPRRDSRGRRYYSPSRDDNYGRGYGRDRGRDYGDYGRGRRSPPRRGYSRGYTRSPTREDDPRGPRDRPRGRYREDRSPTREDDPRGPRDRLQRRHPEDRSPERLSRPPTGIHGTFRSSRAPSTEYQEHRPGDAPHTPSRHEYQERRPGDAPHTPSRRRSSQSPTRVPAPTSRGPEHVQADDDDHRAPPIRVTVPTSQRPPTVMTLEPEELHGVSRVPTRHRPSGADYRMRPSTYHPDEPEYDEGDSRRPPASVHRAPTSRRSSPSSSPPSRHTSPSRRPSPPSRPSTRPQESHPAATTEDDAGRPARTHETGDEPIHGILRPPRTEASTRADMFDAPEPFPPHSHATGDSYLPPPSVVRPGPLHTDADAPHVTPPDRRATATPFDLGPADDQRERLERLDEVALRLHDAAVAAQEAEDQREVEFRHQEEERQRLFLDNEERRNEDSRTRNDTIWRELDSRLAALPPPASAPAISAEDVEGEPLASDRASIASIRTAAQQAASQHASDVLETIRLEREDFAKEREAAAAERDRLIAEVTAERDRLLEDRESRIKALEDELDQVRNDLENEKQQRLTEEAETRERERQEFIERDEYVRNQLGDITNLVQDQGVACERKKELMEERWQDKLSRRQEKDDKWLDLSELVQKIHNDMENDRQRAAEEKEAAEARGLERMIQELQKQTAEQRELLELFSESWRADCAKHHEDTINAVRQTAQEQVPFNVQGYLDEFSKALASEVRMLLGEVGKLREERRALQHELGYLLCMKSKYGPGGEFDPEWRPPAGGPGGPGGPSPQEPPGPPPPGTQQPDLPPIAKPAWRSVPKKKDKKTKKAEKQQQQMAAQQPHDFPGMPGPSYAHMQDPRRQIQSWATWQPDPALHPTPPSVEPTLLVPDRGSPGLFGPRSESDTLSYQQPRR